MPRILLIGATGLVGGLFADRVRAAGGHELHTLARRRAGGGSHEHVAPPDRWPEMARGLGADVAVSALGTTMRKAGTQAAFRAVDLDMVVAFARAALEGGARHMIMVSSVGADAGSRNFYLRTKGETERALRESGFDRLDVVRPGLLRGDRGPERRLRERIGIRLSPLTNPLLRGPLAPYAAIDASVVAEAMLTMVDQTHPGMVIHHNPDLRRLASR